MSLTPKEIPEWGRHIQVQKILSTAADSWDALAPLAFTTNEDASSPHHRVDGDKATSPDVNGASDPLQDLFAAFTNRVEQTPPPHTSKKRPAAPDSARNTNPTHLKFSAVAKSIEVASTMTVFGPTKGSSATKYSSSTTSLSNWLIPVEQEGGSSLAPRISNAPSHQVEM